MFIPQRVAEASQEVGKGLAFRSVTATGKKTKKLSLPYVSLLSFLYLAVSMNFQIHSGQLLSYFLLQMIILQLLTIMHMFIFNYLV